MEVAAEAFAIEQSLDIVPVTQIAGRIDDTHERFDSRRMPGCCSESMWVVRFEVVFHDGMRRVLVSE